MSHSQPFNLCCKLCLSSKAVSVDYGVRAIKAKLVSHASL